MKTKKNSDTLKKFMGRKTFKKFVFHLKNKCNKKKRLLFWQEQILHKFNSQSSSHIPLQYEELCSALGIETTPSPIQKTFSRLRTFLHSLIQKISNKENFKQLFYPVDSHTDLLLAAYQSAPFFYRTFHRSKSSHKTDALLKGFPEWEKWKSQRQTKDQIWPFQFHTRAFLGARKGFLIIRNGTPLTVILTDLS